MIRSLSIQNWKGHEKLNLSFDPGINFLIGPNGIGKTSILDAITFAFLGDIETTSIYKGLTYKDLIRDIENDMSISLDFNPSGKGEYQIVRAYNSTAKRKNCQLKYNNSVISNKWDEATDIILDLFDTSELFLRRVIMLSEGDTFDYATRPPGEGLTKHIEKVLGINRMEDFRGNLREIRRSFDLKISDSKTEIKKIEMITEEEREKLAQLNKDHQDANFELNNIKNEISKLDEQLRNLDTKIENAEGLIKQVDNIIVDWTTIIGTEPKDNNLLSDVEKKLESLDFDKSKVLEKRDELRDEISWSTSQIESLNSILGLIEPLDGEKFEHTPCPICKRPLTEEMIESISKETHDLIESNNERLDKKQKQIPKIDSEINGLENKINEFTKLQYRIISVLEHEPKTVSKNALVDYMSQFQKQRKKIFEEIENKNILKTEKEKSAKDIETQIIELRVKTDATNQLSIYESKISATKGKFIADLLLDSLEASLDKQLSTQIDPLTKELSEMWGDFLGKKVSVTFQDKAQLNIHNEITGASISFPQLSGGEKTGLLIFTQILLCKYFSETDFMLLDEPLEHLDSVNRWALINYLIETTKNSNYKQLIVTTVEETLLREYMDDPMVKIFILSKDYPIISKISDYY